MKKIVVLVLLAFLISGCKYTTPFVEFYDANNLENSGKYAEAIPHYERAIKGFSKVSVYESFEYAARCSYALMLNQYSKNGESNHILTARENFNLVLSYLKKGNKTITCSEGVAMSSWANTIQQQAAYSNNEEEYYKLLEQAYVSYKDALQPLKNSRDWLSLAYTYYNLAETSEWYGDISEAIKWINKAIEIDKKYQFTENLAEDSQYLSQLKDKKERTLAIGVKQ